MIEQLAERNPETYQWEPRLAISWAIAKDGLSYTFKIRKGVKWQDGTPLRVEDIKFAFDAIMDPKNTYKTAHLRPYFENIDKCKIIDSQTVQFIFRKKYFANFSIVASLSPLPRHIYRNPDKKTKKKLNKTLVGTGPYRFNQWKRGKYIKLVANKNWWGKKNPDLKNQYNYSQILMRFVKDGPTAIQYLQKGDLDFNSLTAEEYMKKTQGPLWGKKVFKVKFQNSAPKGYGFIGWNLKHDILKDKRVRLALYHLIDRRKMIQKFDYGFNVPATGPWYRQSIYADPKVKPIEYAPKTAPLSVEQVWMEGFRQGWRAR